MGGQVRQKHKDFHELIRISKGKYMDSLKVKNRTPEIKNYLGHINRRLDTEHKEKWKLS